MNKFVEIKSPNSDYKLIFSDREEDYFTVSLEGRDRSGRIRVWGYTDCSELVSLFSFMAANSNGWDGTQSWFSLEREFEIHVTSDKLGHISLRSILRSNLGLDEEWKLEAIVMTEAGQLENIAAEVADFFGITDV